MVGQHTKVANIRCLPTWWQRNHCVQWGNVYWAHSEMLNICHNHGAKKKKLTAGKVSILPLLLHFIQTMWPCADLNFLHCFYDRHFVLLWFLEFSHLTNFVNKVKVGSERRKWLGYEKIWQYLHMQGGSEASIGIPLSGQPVAEDTVYARKKKCPLTQFEWGVSFSDRIATAHWVDLFWSNPWKILANVPGVLVFFFLFLLWLCILGL